MLIMTQDRISGLSSNKSPLRTYGPGNTRDESNRNSWVSSDGNDKLTINCLGQVNGLFLGRYQADRVRLTYQGDEMFSNKTSSGFVSVGYPNGSNGFISAEITGIVENPGGYYYSSGTLITISLSVDSDYINVNDIITITGANSSFNGLHRIVQVQKDTSFTRLNNSGNSLFFQQQGETGNSIQVIVKDNFTTVSTYLSVGDTLNIQNGADVPILPQGLPGTQCGIIEDEDDINFTYFVKFSHSVNYLLKSGDSPFTVGEYISFEDCSIRSISGSTTSHNFDFTENGFESYYVSDTNAQELSFTIFVKPETFLSKNLVIPFTTLGSPKASFGSSFSYNGGGYQHKLGLSLITGTTLSTGSEEFTNEEVVELSEASISSVAIPSGGLAQITLNGIDQDFLHIATIKNRFQYSIKLPFRFKIGSSILTNGNFIFTGSDSIQLRKYVVDTDDSGTTDTGAGTPIRRIDIATRTQNTVADFVTGKLIRVESNYIPLPREAFPSRITIEMDSTLNHNAANLFNEFLLEEITIEDPDVNATLPAKDVTDDEDYATYSMSVSTYLYNTNDDGELTLNLGANSTIETDDYIFLNWPNNIPAQNNTITKTVQNVLTTTVFQSSTTIHELYEGMQINGTNDTYILSIDTTTNQITTNIAHGLSNGSTVTFDHHPSLGTIAHDSWKGIHRVVSSENSGSIIKIIVPNAGVKGDLTINENAQAKSASGAYLLKVSNGKGRFIRPITSGVTTCDAFLWNSDQSNSVNYTYGGQVYEVAAGTAHLIFSSPHSLVNNDKIIIYDLKSNTNGQHIKGLDSSYLVTYASSNIVSISIKKALSKDIAGLSVTSDNNLLVITNDDHTFSVGDKVTLNNMPSYTDQDSATVSANGQFVIATTPTSKSFTVDVGGAGIQSGYTFSLGGSEEAIIGVHYLTAPNGTYATNSTGAIPVDVKCSRSVSISDALSSFENPIEVGNLLYRDSLQFSSGIYEAVNDDTATFTKTPNIDDATSTIPYRPDSDTSIQNTFSGTDKSVVSQISLIRGDATTEKDIHLVKPFGRINEPYTFTRLLQGLRVAIVRAGVSRTLPNPQTGVTNSLKDFSVRKELPTGAYYYLNRDSAKEFAGKIISDPESVDLLVDFGAEQLARPFPCLVISGNKGNMKKLRTRTALYGYFTTLPQATFSNKLVNLKEASFSIREVL